MNDIPEEALKTIEENFGARFVRHATGEAEPDAEEPFASVFPESVEEVRLLTRLGARYNIPLMARGAGTALYPGRAVRTLLVRFDAMRGIRLPESGEGWVEVEPGVNWLTLENHLRPRGLGRGYIPRARPGLPWAAGWPRTGWGLALTSTGGCFRTSSRWRPCWRGASGISSKEKT